MIMASRRDGAYSDDLKKKSCLVAFLARATSLKKPPFRSIGRVLTLKAIVLSVWIPDLIVYFLDKTIFSEDPVPKKPKIRKRMLDAGYKI